MSELRREFQLAVVAMCQPLGPDYSALVIADINHAADAIRAGECAAYELNPLTKAIVEIIFSHMLADTPLQLSAAAIQFLALTGRERSN